MNIRNQAIVANIKDIATMRRTTIKQIEKDLGFGNGMIGKWKSAPKSPPFEKIEMIAEYLGVTVDDLTSTAEAQAEYPELWAAAEAKIRMDDALAGIKKAPDPKIEGVSAEAQEILDYIRDATPAELAEVCRYIGYLKSKRGTE